MTLPAGPGLEGSRRRRQGGRFRLTSAEWQAVVDQVLGVDAGLVAGRRRRPGLSQPHGDSAFATLVTRLRDCLRLSEQKLTLRQDFQGKWNMVLASPASSADRRGCPERDASGRRFGGTRCGFSPFTPPNQPVRERTSRRWPSWRARQPLEWTLSVVGPVGLTPLGPWTQQ